MDNIVIVGATSAIAEAAARQWAEKGAKLFLVGRNEEKLEAIRKDLTVRGASLCESYRLDMNDFEQHKAMLDQAELALGHIDVMLIAHGTLGDQDVCQNDVDETLQEIRTNGLSVIALLTDLANRLARQQSGTIAVISSVAGNRGRQSNYVYGAAKGMVSIFLAGLRNRLFQDNVHVLTIKPGFVDTPMTAHLPKGPLWAQPEQVAKGILKAIDKRQNEIYLPGFWRLIMLIIGHIPEFVFKRLKL